MHIKQHPYFGEIKRDSVSFRFEGKLMKGKVGQSIAAALMANGIYKLGTSRKLNQPRGVFCNNGRCFRCYVTVNDVPHVLACSTKIEEGMEIFENPIELKLSP